MTKKVYFFHCNEYSLSRGSRYHKNNYYLMLERALIYHQNKYHLINESKNQSNVRSKDIMVNIEGNEKKECFNDISTIKSSIFNNSTYKYVAEAYDLKESLSYFQTNSSHEYNNCEPSSLVGIALYDSSIAFKHMIK